MIEEEAKKNKYVLVTEPAREGGKCVTGRKGVGRFEMRITGRPSHSGAKHEEAAAPSSRWPGRSNTSRP